MQKQNTFHKEIRIHNKGFNHNFSIEKRRLVEYDYILYLILIKKIFINIYKF